MAAFLCDLVLLSWNHLEELTPCLETLFEHTDVPSRLFIVDNASEPPVRAVLSSVRPRGAIQEVVLLQSETNEGFPKGMNRGLRASTAPYVCLLNNDLRFTVGWLLNMIEIAEAHPEIGIVNPTSNTFGNHPPKGMSVDDYARSLQSRQGLYVELGIGIGFCLLIKRSVIDRIGFLTEEVDRFFFEDEDYCLRAKAAGFQCVVAEASYVFHAEHRSVQQLPEREALFRRNRAWCEHKWGRRLRVAAPRFTRVRLGTSELRPWLEQLIQWARQRTLVYVYCAMPDGMSSGALFRSVGLVPHANISWRRLPRWGIRTLAMAAILKRRKKQFDGIITSDVRWAAVMRRLRALHRARVVIESDQEAMTQLWESRFQFPSSS